MKSETRTSNNENPSSFRLSYALCVGTIPPRAASPHHETAGTTSGPGNLRQIFAIGEYYSTVCGLETVNVKIGVEPILSKNSPRLLTTRPSSSIRLMASPSHQAYFSERFPTRASARRQSSKREGKRAETSRCSYTSSSQHDRKHIWPCRRRLGGCWRGFSSC